MSDAPAWNAFVAAARNGVFLFHRDYMDYHADRFTDHSLLFFQDEQLCALLPANARDGTLYSHGGLTYGGLVLSDRVGAAAVLELFAALADYAREQGLQRLVYKPLPHIYHRAPAEEDLYALFRQGARLVRRDVAATIDMGHRLEVTKGRKWGANKARKVGVSVRRSDDIEAFMEMEAENLRARYGVNPVHTPAEMRLLATRFPENIKLFAAYEGTAMLAGCIVYESTMVAHAQYIASNERGRALAALDGLFDHLLHEVFAAKRYFDFGISTEDQGRSLNVGLCANKESYGARATAYDWYELGFAPEAA